VRICLEYSLTYSVHGLRVYIRILQCTSHNLECASHNLKCVFHNFILFTVHTLPSRDHHTTYTFTQYMRSEYFLYCIWHQTAYYTRVGARIAHTPCAETNFSGLRKPRGRDNTPIFCALTQTCSPKGAKRPYITTVSDVVLLNYLVGLSKDTHYGNTQGVWVCHLPRDCLPLQKLLQSPTFMKDLEKLPRTYRKKTPLQTSKGVS